MENYQEERVKLTNSQLKKKKKTCSEKQSGNNIKIKKQKLLRFSYELFLTTRKRTKIRKAFTNNMSIDVKLTKAQIYKIIQSSGTIGSWLANLRKEITSKCCYSFN